MVTQRIRSTPRGSFGRTLRNFLVFLAVIACVSAAIAVALVYAELSSNLPPVEQLAQYRPAMATQILADDGSVVGEFFYEKRYVVPVERIPAQVRNAFIAAEDAAFYTHKGVDPIGIARAFLNNLSKGEAIQGGSTITQQVVKSLLLTPKKSYERKVKEVILALQIEQQLSKEQILFLYLNHIYLGSGAYGVAAAAQEYFGKPVDELSLAEGALLAGLPQAPSRYSPAKHWPRAKERQRYVLERMVAAHLITTDEAQAAAQEPLALQRRGGSFKGAPYYVEHVRRLLDQKYGETALYALGLRVHTPLNLHMQAAAEAALRDGLHKLSLRQQFNGVPTHLDPNAAETFLRTQREQMAGQPLEVGKTYDAIVLGNGPEARRQGAKTVYDEAFNRAIPANAPRLQVGSFKGFLSIEASPDTPAPVYRAGHVVRVKIADVQQNGPAYQFVLDPELQVQGALVALEPATGAVRAMIGGVNFEHSQFNRAVQSARQPGSSFKPFVYAAALDHNFTPASVIVDEPISFQVNDSVWRPHNYEDRYFGPTTLREALTFSRNVVTVKLATRIGMKPLVRYIQRLGIRSPLAPNLSIALGSSELTLIELASAYAVFANQGQSSEPRFITRITDSQGNLIDEYLPQTEQVIAAETAYLMTSMMQSVIDRGTGKRAKALQRPAAGKTGTTNDFNDAWFVGYTPQLLSAIWVGFDEKRPLGKGETGGRVAAPIWQAFMSEALVGQPILDFPIPAGIAFVPIDPHSGQRIASAGAYGFLECFQRGTEPKIIVAPPVQPPDDADLDLFTDLD